MGVIPALDELEHRHARVGLGVETAAVEQLAFKRSEKALAHRIVEAISDRTHRRPHPRLPAAHPEGDRRVLGGFKRSSQHNLLAHRRYWSKASAGVFHPRAFRGLELRVIATAAMSSALCALRSVPFGKNSRSRPLVFVGAALPWAARVTKVDLQPRVDAQVRMLRHLCALIPGQGLSNLLGSLENKSFDQRRLSPYG
jgi:hypothetical protein